MLKINCFVSHISGEIRLVKMKRTAIIVTFSFVLILGLCAVSAAAGDVSFEVKGFYLSPSESAFQDIYGGGTGFGAELNIAVLRSMDLWLGGSYFQRKGELTFTKEETTLRIIPIGTGLRFRFMPNSSISPYVGIGVNYYLYTEENPIGKAEKGALGAAARAGLIVKIAGNFFIDVLAEYSYCKIKPADFRINIGGITGAFGAGVRF